MNRALTYATIIGIGIFLFIMPFVIVLAEEPELTFPTIVIQLEVEPTNPDNWHFNTEEFIQHGWVFPTEEYQDPNSLFEYVVQFIDE